MTWEGIFLAISYIKGFSDIFEMKPEGTPKDTDDLEYDAIVGHELKRDIRNNSRKAYHLLVLRMNGETPHSMVAFTVVRST
jgi:hypothetical protein